jgi:hypothetical protein
MKLNFLNKKEQQQLEENLSDEEVMLPMGMDPNHFTPEFKKYLTDIKESNPFLYKRIRDGY